MDLYDTAIESIAARDVASGNYAFIFLLFILSWALGVQVYWALQMEAIYGYILRGEGKVITVAFQIFSSKFFKKGRTCK